MLQSSLAEDTHSPEKARVNLPAKSFAKFAEAFQCKAGSAMAPKDRCQVW